MERYFQGKRNGRRRGNGKLKEFTMKRNGKESGNGNGRGIEMKKVQANKFQDQTNLIYGETKMDKKFVRKRDGKEIYNSRKEIEREILCLAQTCVEWTP